jgi:putative integral membrane protein (TIGR02587 family)
MSSKAAPRSAPAGQGSPLHFLHALLWAFGGALLFALPTLMTMEMWALATQITDLRFALFIAGIAAMLIGMSHYAGFEETSDFGSDIADGFIAFLVGAITAAVVLLVFGVVSDPTVDELIGAIGLLALPCGIGAALARHLLGHNGGDRETRRQRNARYPGQLFLMSVGAFFLSFSVAPTEEMMLIAYKMSAWHTLGLIVLSLALMHAFVGAHVYEEREEHGATWLAVFARFTVTGYALALAISAYMLWTFGRLDGLGLEQIAKVVVVLGLPAAIGAAASRLIL